MLWIIHGFSSVFVVSKYSKVNARMLHLHPEKQKRTTFKSF